jgi:hypothetical protein
MLQLTKTRIAASSICILLAACGGGGGSGTSPTAATSTTTSTSNNAPGTPTGSSGATAATFTYDETARFNGPAGVRSDAAGNLYVFDADSKSIRKIAADGSVSTLAVGIPGFNAASMDVDAAGNVYIASDGQNNIYKVTPAGTISVFATFPGPKQVTVDTQGNVYALGSDATSWQRIVRVTPSGEISTISASTMDAEYVGLTIDAAGNLYTISRAPQDSRFKQGTVLKIAPNGAQTNFADFDFEIYPDDVYGRTDVANMSTDAAGNIYVAHHRVHSVSPGCGNQCPLGRYESGMSINKITPAGVNTRLRTGPPGSTGKLGTENVYDHDFSKSFIDAGVDGNLYATYYRNQTVYRISPSGETTLIAGKPGETGNAD